MMAEIVKQVEELLNDHESSEDIRDQLGKHMGFIKQMDKLGVLKKQSYNASPLDLTGVRSNLEPAFLVK